MVALFPTGAADLKLDDPDSVTQLPTTTTRVATGSVTSVLAALQLVVPTARFKILASTTAAHEPPDKVVLEQAKARVLEAVPLQALLLKLESVLDAQLNLLDVVPVTAQTPSTCNGIEVLVPLQLEA